MEHRSRSLLRCATFGVKGLLLHWPWAVPLDEKGHEFSGVT